MAAKKTTSELGTKSKLGAILVPYNQVGGIRRRRLQAQKPKDAHVWTAPQLMPSQEELDALQAFDRELDELLGFRVVETSKRLEEALAGASEGVKDGLRNALMTIRNYQTMYAPERVAAKRWYDTIRKLRSHLKRFTAYAAVRVLEDSHFAGHAVGNARKSLSARAIHTQQVGDAANMLLELLSAANTQITRYDDDRVKPVDAEGRPTRAVLGSVLLHLSDVGMKPAQIAKLVRDLPRSIAGDGPKARKEHVARVRKAIERARKARPSP